MERDDRREDVLEPSSALRPGSAPTLRPWQCGAPTETPDPYTFIAAHLNETNAVFVTMCLIDPCYPFASILPAYSRRELLEQARQIEPILGTGRFSSANGLRDSHSGDRAALTTYVAERALRADGGYSVFRKTVAS